MRSYQTLQGEKCSLVRCFGNESGLEPKGEQWLEQGERASITRGLLPFLLPDTFLLSDLGRGLDLSLAPDTEAPEKLPASDCVLRCGWLVPPHRGLSQALPHCLPVHPLWSGVSAVPGSGSHPGLEGFLFTACVQADVVLPTSQLTSLRCGHSLCAQGSTWFKNLWRSLRKFWGASALIVKKFSPEIFIKRGRSQTTWIQVPSI